MSSCGISFLARMLAPTVLVIALSASAQVPTASGDVSRSYAGAQTYGLAIATAPADKSVFAGAKPSPSLRAFSSTTPRMIPRHIPHAAGTQHAALRAAPPLVAHT